MFWVAYVLGVVTAILGGASALAIITYFYSGE